MSAIAIASGGSALTPATGNINLFVATTGSDSNDGLTPATAFATIQHAVSVLLSFAYQSLYQGNIKVSAGNYNENVNIANGLFQGRRVGPISASGFITGDPTTPANVKIAPTTGTDAPPLEISGGYWQVDGFRLVADASQLGFPDLLAVSGGSIADLGTMEFDTGNGVGGYVYASIMSVQNYSLIIGGKGSVSGTRNITIMGTYNGYGSVGGTMFNANVYSRMQFQNNLIFNSAVNMLTSPIFQIVNNSTLDLIDGFAAFTNPGNITNGPPVSLTIEAEILIGADPATNPFGAWPGGAFSTSQIDGSCSVDGHFYIQPTAGPPVDETSIYRNSWQISKNTNTGSVNVVYDNAGTLTFPAIPQLILSNGTSAEGIFVYNTVDNLSGSPFTPTNYERGIFDWTTSTNVLLIGTQKGGTGSLRDVGLISSSGNINFYYTGAVSGSNFWGINANGVLSGWGAGSFNYLINTSNTGATFQMSSQIRFQWNSATTLQAGAIDTGLSRSAANVLEINNGTAATGPGVILPRSTTFANLPASPVQGMMISITDGLAANCADGTCTTFGTNVTGGTGALKLNLWYNGTNWTLIGK